MWWLRSHTFSHWLKQYWSPAQFVVVEHSLAAPDRLTAAATHEWLANAGIKGDKIILLSAPHGWMLVYISLKRKQASCFSPWESELSRRTSLPFPSAPRLLNCRGTAEVPQSKSYCEVMEIYRAVIVLSCFKSYQSDRTDESTCMPPMYLSVGNLGFIQNWTWVCSPCLLSYLYYPSKVRKRIFWRNILFSPRLYLFDQYSENCNIVRIFV